MIVESKNNYAFQGQMLIQRFPGGSDGKESACNVGDPGSIPQLGRSPGESLGHHIYVFEP